MGHPHNPPVFVPREYNCVVSSLRPPAQGTWAYKGWVAGMKKFTLKIRERLTAIDHTASVVQVLEFFSTAAWPSLLGTDIVCRFDT